MKYRLGKLPARPDPRDFKLKSYLNRKLPTPPYEFGHSDLIEEWGMLANDRLGLCVLAGFAHQQMVASAEGGQLQKYNDDAVIKAYCEAAGYDPRYPWTDCGTNVRAGYKYWKSKGIPDANGERRKLKAFIALDAGDTLDLDHAIWLFGSAGIGVAVPDSCIEQFDRGEPWTVVKDSPVGGGHYIPVIDKRGGYYWVVTWGKLQPMTPDFFETYCDEAWCGLSEDMFRNGKTLENFDLPKLERDLVLLAAS